MPRFRDYYRQFEEMRPEEISAELRALRDERRQRALSRIDALDLSGAGWHEPPHPDAVNAATFALRRALHAYPDASAGPLREALAARHGVAVKQVAVGHGAGELLRAALPDDGAEVLVAWPGWQQLPGVVEAAGGRAVPVPAAPAEILAHAGRETRAVVLTSPSDTSGATFSRRAVRDVCAGVPDGVTVIVDEALAEFAGGSDAPPRAAERTGAVGDGGSDAAPRAPERAGAAVDGGSDAAPLVAEVDNLLVVRSFSKAHAMAGLRAGAVLGPPELVARLAPSGGLGAPAQAAAAWAASDPGAVAAARRRAAAAALHERLAAALAGSPFSAAPGTMPFAWLSSSEEDGAAIAARLAAAQVFVAPGRLWGDERHVRAALRGPEAVDRLARALLGG